MTDDLIDTISKCFSGAMYRQLQPDVGEYAPTKSWGTIVCICEDTTNDKPHYVVVYSMHSPAKTNHGNGGPSGGHGAFGWHSWEVGDVIRGLMNNDVESFLIASNPSPIYAKEEWSSLREIAMQSFNYKAYAKMFFDAAMINFKRFSVGRGSGMESAPANAYKFLNIAERMLNNEPHSNLIDEETQEILNSISTKTISAPNKKAFKLKLQESANRIEARLKESCGSPEKRLQATQRVWKWITSARPIFLKEEFSGIHSADVSDCYNIPSDIHPLIARACSRARELLALHNIADSAILAVLTYGNEGYGIEPLHGVNNIDDINAIVVFASPSMMLGAMEKTSGHPFTINHTGNHMLYGGSGLVLHDIRKFVLNILGLNSMMDTNCIVGVYSQIQWRSKFFDTFIKRLDSINWLARNETKSVFYRQAVETLAYPTAWSLTHAGAVLNRAKMGWRHFGDCMENQRLSTSFSDAEKGEYLRLNAITCSFDSPEFQNEAKAVASMCCLLPARIKEAHASTPRFANTQMLGYGGAELEPVAQLLSSLYLGIASHGIPDVPNQHMDALIPDTDADDCTNNDEADNESPTKKKRPAKKTSSKKSDPKRRKKNE